MQINITNKTLQALSKKLGKKSDQLGTASWRFQSYKHDHIVDLSLDEMDIATLEIVRDALKEAEEPSSRRVSQLLNALKDPTNKRVTTLSDFPKLLKSFLMANGSPWLHALEADRKGVAYAVTNCEYHAAIRNDGEPYVKLELSYNTKMQHRQYNLHLRHRDMNTTVPQILRQHNLMVPDEDMIAEHKKLSVKFEKFGGMQGEQFWVRKEANLSDRDREDWWRSSTLDLSFKGKPSKAVLDMEASRDSDRTRPTIHSGVYSKNVPVPTHPVLSVFSMVYHKNVWVNVGNMKEYKYEEGLKDRLVLPASHRRLIGALVSNLDVLRMENESEDRSRTIRAKASSSIILAKGPAGTGKTLTAEVYAEEIKRPLYEISSGQIGTDPEEIETNLMAVLARSTKLKMPLLINEADVFVQKRGRDIMQNAVVSVFLRLLEYHNGLIFLTTNRADDIDDAIISRCLAEIAYDEPEADERRQLWVVLMNEFNVTLSKAELAEAVLVFPTVVGRDIQNLIRLTSRVCAAVEEPFNLQALKENAVFRGIEVDKTK